MYYRDTNRVHDASFFASKLSLIITEYAEVLGCKASDQFLHNGAKHEVQHICRLTEAANTIFYGKLFREILRPNGLEGESDLVSKLAQKGAQHIFYSTIMDQHYTNIVVDREIPNEVTFRGWSESLRPRIRQCCFRFCEFATALKTLSNSVRSRAQTS